MAIYRLSASIVKRSQGRSAVACAAYRSGEALPDERQGLLHDYTRRQGVLHTEIAAPDGTPQWMLDRSQLWNAVEAVERRKDSQLAREVLLALPHELTDAERLALVRGFIDEQFVARGMIADFAIHTPDPQGDNRNHHCHIMLTTRELTGDSFGQKVREWNRTEELQGWREQWAVHVNRGLEQAGREDRVDHRSLEDRGIDAEPEPKQGPVATEMERQGQQSHAGDDRRAAKDRNAERAERRRQAEILDFEIARAKRDAREQWAEVDSEDPQQARRERWRERGRARFSAEREAERAQRKQEWDRLKAEQAERRQALDKDLDARRATRHDELEAQQARRALREEAEACAPPPEPDNVFGRVNRRLHTSWNRFLDALDHKRVEERLRREEAEAQERAARRAEREARERARLDERQDDYDARVRRANGWKDKGEARELIQQQDREKAEANERRRQEIAALRAKPDQDNEPTPTQLAARQHEKQLADQTAEHRRRRQTLDTELRRERLAAIRQLEAEQRTRALDEDRRLARVQHGEWPAGFDGSMTPEQIDDRKQRQAERRLAVEQARRDRERQERDKLMAAQKEAERRRREQIVQQEKAEREALMKRQAVEYQKALAEERERGRDQDRGRGRDIEDGKAKTADKGRDERDRDDDMDR